MNIYQKSEQEIQVSQTGLMMQCWYLLKANENLYFRKKRYKMIMPQRLAWKWLLGISFYRQII